MVYFLSVLFLNISGSLTNWLYKKVIMACWTYYWLKSSGLNKRINVRDFRTDFFRFYFSFFSIVLVLVKKIYQAPKTGFQNTSKFIKNTPMRVWFSTLFSFFRNVVKNRLSRLIYSINFSKITYIWGLKEERLIC